MQMSEEIKKWYQEIGRKGGLKSKRTITPEQQKMMREARDKAREKRNEKKS